MRKIKATDGIKVFFWEPLLKMFIEESEVPKNEKDELDFFQFQISNETIGHQFDLAIDNWMHPEATIFDVEMIAA